MPKRSSSSSSEVPEPPIRGDTSLLLQQVSRAEKSKGFSRKQRARIARDRAAAHIIDQELRGLDPLHGINFNKYGQPKAGLKPLPARLKRAPTPPPTPSSSSKVLPGPAEPTSISSSSPHSDTEVATTDLSPTSDYRSNQPLNVPPPPPDPRKRWYEAQSRLNAYRDHQVDLLIEKAERAKASALLQAKIEEESKELGNPWDIDEEVFDELVKATSRTSTSTASR